jgi:hypothetical protein
MTTAATPARFMSSTSAARGERSMIRPRAYGPRSLILTMTERLVEVRYLRVGGQWEQAMRGGGSDGVEPLAARGSAALEVIPGSLPELTAPSRAHRVATGIADPTACSCYSPEGCALLVHLLGAMAGRPAFLSSPAGEAARSIWWHFCVSGEAGGVTGVGGRALF